MSGGLRYSEFRFYDFTLDAEVSRISAWNARGQEYFVRVPLEGAGFPARREEALQMLALAIEDGRPAGEMQWVDQTAQTKERRQRRERMPA